MFITPWYICSFSVGSFSDCDFLNWLCFLLMWFYLHLEIFPAAEWATHLGKMFWEEMKSMWESPEAFPHLEFSWFPGNCLVLCRTLQISVLVPGRTMSVPLLFQARGCSMGFQPPPHRLVQSACCREHRIGLLGFNYSVVLNAYLKLKELKSEQHLLLYISLCFVMLGCFLQWLLVLVSCYRSWGVTLFDARLTMLRILLS